MLKSWSIQNFKPILDSGDLPLAPVTVLAGRNSSGKSSLIQSILMIAQTLSNRIPDRALLPNGPIVQLGTFEDILSEQTDLRTLTVGFQLEMGKEELGASVNGHFRPLRRYFTASDIAIKSVKVTSQFRSASSNGTRNSAIEASKVNVEGVSLEVRISHSESAHSQSSLFPDAENVIESNFDMDIKRLSAVELDDFLKNVSPEYLRLVPYTTNETNYLGTFTIKDELANLQVPQPALIAFSHFLPTRLIGKYFTKERRKSQLIQAVSIALIFPGDNLALFKDLADTFDSSSALQESLRETMLDFCKAEGISKTFSGQTLEDLILWYKSLKLGQGKENISNKLIEIVAQGILEQSSYIEENTEALEAIANDIYIQNLEGALEEITQFFTSKIRYLGPLRADPQSAQRFAPSSELDDVGQKGEYAAAVYDANQNASIQWYNPLTSKTERNTLKVALDTWVSYLGVANEVKIQMAGQSGVSWQVVHQEGHKALPLTAVGVGVSQVLPILVMGLLAPDNTLLLVEQPELHLHPRVQARLGDFFMGLTQCGKQCLIETHSENLISQLRVHIVEAGGQEKSNCLIYFVDQDEQGAARFNPVEISAQGNILNWPDGFFDETMLQEDRITAAGLKKRAKKASNG
jgi:predicted ATPase